MPCDSQLALQLQETLRPASSRMEEFCPSVSSPQLRFLSLPPIPLFMCGRCCQFFLIFQQPPYFSSSFFINYPGGEGIGLFQIQRISISVRAFRRGSGGQKILSHTFRRRAARTFERKRLLRGISRPGAGTHAILPDGVRRRTEKAIGRRFRLPLFSAVLSAQSGPGRLPAL